jgi:hypothetical protein
LKGAKKITYFWNILSFSKFVLILVFFCISSVVVNIKTRILTGSTVYSNVSWTRFISVWWCALALNAALAVQCAIEKLIFSRQTTKNFLSSSGKYCALFFAVASTSVSHLAV